VARTLKADKVLAEPDENARAAYEERAAQSAPAVEEEGAGEPAKTGSSS
jgi:hypothetical protein